MSDIEAGIGVMMQEIEQHSAAARVSPPPILSRSASNGLRDAVGIPLPASPSPIASPTTPTPNLLEEDSPEPLPTPPIVPSISTSTPAPEKQESESPVLISTEDAEETAPDTTIRLVGGATPIPVPVAEEFLSGDGVLVSTPPADEDSSDFTSVPLSDAAAKKQEKRSSISVNLKKFGNLGGKRKKDSVSSMKEVV